MAKSHLRVVTPTTVNRTVAPKRPPNADLRTRECLTEAEVERLLKATKGNRHGLRASELTDLRWDQIDLATATLHVRRMKQGSPCTHPILGDELRALRWLQSRTGAEIALRVHLGARFTLHHRRLRAHDRARRPDDDRRRSPSCSRAQAAQADAAQKEVPDCASRTESVTLSLGFRKLTAAEAVTSYRT
jgi:integrase